MAIMSTCTVASGASSSGWATVVLAGRGGLMNSRRTSWYGSTCARAVTNWFSQTPCVTLVPASLRAASIVAKIDRASRIPLASPARGSAGLPRTSGASPPPTGPPIVPDTKTQGPAFTAFGIRSGGGGETGNQMLFLAMASPWTRGLRRGVGLEIAREETLGDEAERSIGRVAQRAEDGEDDEHAIRLHEQTRLLQQETEPGVRGEDLGRDDAETRRPERDAHAGDDRGHGRREHDEGEDLGLRRAQALGRPHARPRRRHHAVDRVDEDDEEGAPEDQEVLRRLADAEPDHRDGDHGGGREEAEELDHGVQEVVQRADAPHEDAHDDAERAAEREPDRDAREAGGHVTRDLGRREHRHRGAQHLGGGRDEVAAHHVRGDELPHGDETSEREDEHGERAHALH